MALLVVRCLTPAATNAAFAAGADLNEAAKDCRGASAGDKVRCINNVRLGSRSAQEGSNLGTL